jgi:hypothetical protein
MYPLAPEDFHGADGEVFPFPPTDHERLEAMRRIAHHITPHTLDGLERYKRLQAQHTAAFERLGSLPLPVELPGDILGMAARLQTLRQERNTIQQWCDQCPKHADWLRKGPPEAAPMAADLQQVLDEKKKLVAELEKDIAGCSQEITQALNEAPGLRARLKARLQEQPESETKTLTDLVFEESVVANNHRALKAKQDAINIDLDQVVRELRAHLHAVLDGLDLERATTKRHLALLCNLHPNTLDLLLGEVEEEPAGPSAMTGPELEHVVAMVVERTHDKTTKVFLNVRPANKKSKPKSTDSSDGVTLELDVVVTNETNEVQEVYEAKLSQGDIPGRLRAHARGQRGPFSGTHEYKATPLESGEKTIVTLTFPCGGVEPVFVFLNEVAPQKLVRSSAYDRSLYSTLAWNQGSTEEGMQAHLRSFYKSDDPKKVFLETMAHLRAAFEGGRIRRLVLG